MGLLGLFGGVEKEKRTQLFFRDDGSFVFRRLEIEDTFLVVKKDGDIVKGWKHFFKNQFPFGGYSNIGADMVTLSYDRDIILDPYNLVGEKEKPDEAVAQDSKGNGKGQIKSAQPWLVEVGNARRLKMISNRGKSSIFDKIVLFIGATLIFEVLIIGIMVAASRGGGG